MSFPPLPRYPYGIDDDSTLYLVYNTSESPLTENNEPWSDEVSVKPQDELEIWADNGFATINGEIFYYSAVEKNDDGFITKLRKCIRNLGGEHTQFNLAGTMVRGFVMAEHHNQLVDTVMRVENFVGENFSEDEETLDWRIRNLRAAPIIFDDFDCPDVSFTFNIIENDPASGILANYTISIVGTYSNFTLNFGDGTFTKSVASGQHRYAPNASIDPVITISNEKCEIVQTPIERQLTDKLPEETPDVILNLPVPVCPDIGDITIPAVSVPDQEIVIPPIVMPCLDVSPFPSTFFGPISITVDFSPVNIPSVIDVVVPEIPPISITPIDIPPISVSVPEIPNISITTPEFPEISITLPDFPEISITIPEFPELSLTIPPFPDININIPPFPDININIPAFPDITIGIPGFPDISISIPPFPEISVSVPQFPDINVNVPPFPMISVVVPPFPAISVVVPPFPVISVDVPPFPTIQVDVPPFPSIQVDVPPFPSIQVDLPPFPTIQVDVPTFPAIQIDVPTFPEISVSVPQFPEISIDVPPFPDITIIVPDFPTINFGPTPTFPNVQFDPTPTFDPVGFQNPPCVPVCWGSPPTIPVNVTVTCNCGCCPEGGSVAPLAEPEFMDTFNPFMPQDASAGDQLEINYDFQGFPSVIVVEPPVLPDIKVVSDIPSQIDLVAPDKMIIEYLGPAIPSHIELVVPEDPVKLVYEGPKTIKLEASDSLAEGIKLILPDVMPTIKLDVSDLPSVIQVVGVPSVLEVVGFKNIELIMPENPTIQMLPPKEAIPISVMVTLSLDNVQQMVAEKKVNCVTFVPCDT